MYSKSLRRETVDTISLEPLIRHFLDTLSSDPSLQEHLEQHQSRIQNARQLFQLDHIPDLTREEIETFLQDTDAYYGVRGRQRLWRKLFGEQNERLPILRETFADLIRRAETGLTAADFNEIRESLPGIGPAFLSELLALRFPDRYWVWNKPIRNFLKEQGIDVKEELEWGKKGDLGEQYLVAGRHLDDVRRVLGEAAGRPVDYMFNDLFIWWANRQEQVGQEDNRWAERIARWQQELLPAERLQARREGESRARTLLENKLGTFVEDDLRQFLTDLSTDYWADGNLSHNRFMPALYGAQVKLMAETLEAFNTWVARIWQAEDAELDELLNDFWAKLEVGGAGVSLPTAILYLREPERYNIWLPVMSKGLKIVTGFEPGRWRTSRAYRRYNRVLNELREQHDLPPQAPDVILWQIARSAEPDGTEVFPGFTEETFRFLEELATNNSAEWMHRDGDANEQRYRRVLREPLRSLFKAVAPIVTEMDPTFETEAKFGKVMASIKKRWPDEEGPYSPYLWGAFYRQGQKKQTDAQLFVIVHPDHMNAGFSVAGAQGSDVLSRFRHNLEQAPEMFLQLLADLPDDIEVSVAERHGASQQETLSIEHSDDLQPLFESDLINVQRRYLANAPILFEPEFAEEVGELFQALYPLYRFATTDNLDDLVDLIEVDIGDGPIERYTLEDLCQDTYLEIDFWREVLLLIQDKKQIIFYGPPGTGKTWVARHFARYWVDEADDPGGDVQVVQFHPSYAYEEFVEGIRPESIKGAEGQHALSYPVKKGIFRRLCDQARLHPQRRYALVLDEINRGELPRILGELLYVIEYRRESIILPYSREPFAIPANLYLIGTMNTADRSIALVDHALRRRFHFVQMRPDSDILRVYFEITGDPKMVWAADLLDLMNNQLEKDGIEWHLHIGHSHFMRPDLDEARLRLIWKHSIMPTLGEYFYRQAERLASYRLNVLKEALGEA